MIYQITLANDFDQFKFNYELNDNNPTKTWVELAKETKPSDLRKSLNPWRGISTDYSTLVERLNTVINELNEWIPEKITTKWESNDPIKSLNNLHIHFPEHEKTETEFVKRDQLTRFNDLIHGMEVLCSSKQLNVDMIYLLLCCDNSRRIDIEESDYKFFNSELNFGDLTLHYCHVGRHPMEILLSNDYDCPAEQIVPQSQISSYHTLRFFDLPNRKQRFEQFYYDSKLQWPYSLTDERLSFGYINLGRLTDINGTVFDKQETLQIV
ncbi:hypothetical protein EBV26_10015, partial [bacterium]|nr:hypothetical protein [bacterium]